MKRFFLSLAGLLVVIAAAYLVLFGATPPCDAFRARLANALKNDPPEVRRSAAQAAEGLSPVTCTAGAFRLAAGDRSFISVVGPGR